MKPEMEVEAETVFQFTKYTILHLFHQTVPPGGGQKPGHKSMKL